MTSDVDGYHLHNAHGDVVQLTNNTGTSAKTYSYDSFGVESAINDNDTNPFRYCGEYYDKETGSYYLRTRYYNPKTGRFITEDPIRDGLNWYTYCINNPIQFTDPSGFIIQLTGTEEEQKIILENLQKLTDNTLAIDSNGNVYISNSADRDKIKYESGNALISRLIESKYTCSIQVSLGSKENSQSIVALKDAFNGNGSDAFVIFDPTHMPKILTVDPATGNATLQDSQAHIILSHELIHADRSMKGAAIEYSKKGSYKYQIRIREENFLFWSWTKKDYRTQTVIKEELATIGLKYANQGDITENNIRKEQGSNLRGAY